MHETPAGDGNIATVDAGQPVTYRGRTTIPLAAIAPGTYLYHSGTHPAVQVQMGLYGALTKNAVDGGGGETPQQYPPVPAGAGPGLRGPCFRV